MREYPRLADFAEVGEIISRCMGNEPGQFISAYFRNIDLQTREIIESDAVGKAIEIFIDSLAPPLWYGTMTELLEVLTKIAEGNLKINIKNGELWPHVPNSLSRRINEIKADLRDIGIIVERSSVDNSNKQWIIKRSQDNDIGTYIATARNNILYQQEIIRKQNCNKTEHISAISTDRLKLENCTQIANDISVDISPGINHVSTAKYDQNCAYIHNVSRSVDSVDTCLFSSQNHQAKSSKVPDTLGNYVTFDFEWNPVTQVLEAASFVDNLGNSKVMLRSDFNSYSEKELLKCINSKILEYDWSFGWNSTGHASNTGSAKNSDLSVLHERCIANEIQSIVSSSPNGVPSVGHPKHIDLCNVYSKIMVQDTIYRKAYRTAKLDEVSKALLGHGKYKDLSGKDLKSLSIEEQIEYSLKDSQLIMELSRHNDFEVLDAIYAISEITSLDFELVCRTNLSKWWSAIFDKMVKDGECQPRIATSFSGTYQGAGVLVPQQGLYHNVVVVDAISLYPSVAINYSHQYGLFTN